MSRKSHVFAFCLLFLIVVAIAAQAAVVTELVNVPWDGGQLNGGAWWPAISADGRYLAFHAWARNLDPEDGNDYYDIFVLDRMLGTTHIVSLAYDGQPGDEDSLYPAISANGRVVVFASAADNLVAGDTNGVTDIFAHDLDTGDIERVSVSTSGDQADADCEWPAVSGDGRYVVFHTAATTLAPGSNGYAQVYLHDRWAHTTTRLSISTSGEIANLDAMKPRISETGQFVLFCSLASNLAPNDHNNVKDLFLRDVVAGTTERISVADSTGAGGNKRSPAAPPPAITPDGRYVAFSSEADNLVPGDNNGVFDIFVRDRSLGRTELVSVSSAGEQGNDESGHTLSGLAISSDGRYVAFNSLATNLVLGDTNGARDVFLRDRLAGATQRVSVSTSGEQGDADSGYNPIAMSADARIIAFDSWASNFSDEDMEGYLDVFVRGPEISVTPPLVTINDGAAYTGAAQVTLTVANDVWTEVRFRNEFGAWTDWSPAAASVTWQLSPGDGLKWVWVQGRSSASGESEPAAASVVLDTVPPAAPAVIINSGAELGGQQVTLAITRPPDGVEMRVRQEGGAWSDWMPSVPELLWTLSGSGGLTTVYVQVRDPAGNESVEASDDIVFDGIPPSGATITINGGAAATAQRDVVLTLGAADAAEMRLRDEGDDWTAWAPLVTSLGWTLPAGDGLKTIYFQARDAAGNVSEQAYAQITLDTVAPAVTSFVINGGGPSAVSRTVTLTIAAGDAAEMRLCNEDYVWSAWQPFATTKQWVLSPDRGAKLVSLQCRDLAGNASAVSSAAILLTDFADVSADFWAYDEIMACVDADIVQGYADRTYRPKKQVTRGQMATYIARAIAGGEANVPTGASEPRFTDVDAGNAAYEYVQYCADLGVVQGYWNNTYRPDLVVTRGQMAIYVARAIAQPIGEAGLEGYAGPDTPTFPDVGKDNQAYRYIEYCFEHGVVEGYWDGRYQPDKEVLRDQMAVYVKRAFAIHD